MHTEAYDFPLELRKKELELRFLYAESLNTLDDREDQNYKENEGAAKPTGIHLRKLKKGYVKEQKNVEKNHLVQQLENNTHSYL